VKGHRKITQSEKATDQGIFVVTVVQQGLPGHSAIESLKLVENINAMI